MAAPQVTGVVALLAAAKPGITVAEARAAILGSATAGGSLAGKTVTGGRLNARAALDALGLPPGTLPPPAPPVTPSPVAAPTPPAPPVVALLHDTGASGTDGITKDGRISVSGLQPAVRVEYSVNLGRTWTDTFAPRPGANTVLVRQTDSLGQRSAAATLRFRLDTVAPRPPRTVLAHDTGPRPTDRITRDGSLRVTAERGAFVEYSIDDGQTWSGSFAAVEGGNVVRVRQTDVAGNTSTPTATALAFTLLTGNPQIIGIAPPLFGKDGTGGMLDVVVTFSRPVRVTTPRGSVPTVDVMFGSHTVRAGYAGGNGSPQLLFRYRVPAQLAADASAGSTAGALRLPAGSTIQDLAGNLLVF
jgi:hypothetical protein